MRRTLTKIRRCVSMDFLDVLNTRYSCKKFDGRPVSKEKLQLILEAGQMAPTAKNLQQQHIYVLQSPEALAKFDSACPCRYGASTVLVVAFNKPGTYVYQGGKYNSGHEDMAIITTYMMLAATNLGVNSCWLNRFDPDKMAEALGLPEDEVVVCSLDLGYAAPEGKALPNHFSRKPLSETVVYK